MAVATSRIEVGVRELKNNLSRYLEQVKEGTEVLVTERGRPIAHLVSVDGPTDRLAELVAAGAVRAPRAGARRLPRPVAASRPVSDLVAEQRR
jgi:prevent-host-death family protein